MSRINCPSIGYATYNKTRFKRYFYNTLILAIFLLLLPMPFPITSAEVEREVLGTGPGRFNSVVADDVDDDGRCEIVFGNYEGYVTILEYRDNDFYEEWRSPKKGHRVWGIIVADFLGDSTKEIIIGNGDGELYAYDGKTRKEVWYTNEFGTGELVRDVHGLMVHDLGREGEKYLIAGTGYKNDKDLGTIYIYKENDTKSGQIDSIAKIEGVDNRLRGIGVGDVDADSELELVFGSGVATGDRPGEGYVRVYDVDRVLNNDPKALEWKSENLKGDCVAIELADFNGDAYPEIVVGNGYRYQAGWIRIITYDTEVKNYTEYWKSPDIGPKPFGMDVGDIDDDGRLEIVVGNFAGYIYIYEQTASGAKEEWHSGLLGTDLLGIYLYDVDDDGQIEIIGSQGGYIGKGDYTSGYSAPHIYIIDGKTHETEIIIGETHPLGSILFWIMLALIIIVLIGINQYFKYRRRIKDFQEKTKRETRLMKTPPIPALQKTMPSSHVSPKTSFGPSISPGFDPTASPSTSPGFDPTGPSTAPGTDPTAGLSTIPSFDPTAPSTSPGFDPTPKNDDEKMGVRK